MIKKTLKKKTLKILVSFGQILFRTPEPTKPILRISIKTIIN